MSRKKHKPGTCPSCRSYDVYKEEIKENLPRFTCVDCGFSYTIQAPGAIPDGETDEKRPDSLF